MAVGEITGIVVVGAPISQRYRGLSEEQVICPHLLRAKTSDRQEGSLFWCGTTILGFHTFESLCLQSLSTGHKGTNSRTNCFESNCMIFPSYCFAENLHIRVDWMTL